MTTIRTIQSGQLDRFKNQDADKLRGGYYTSPEVARWLCNWAIRSCTDRVLEPSCGEGIFLSEAFDRFTDLGLVSSTRISSNLVGVEVISEEAEQAREYLRDRIGAENNKVVQIDDFFAWWQRKDWHPFNAVIGNPPFIRYQIFPEPYRARAMAIMTELGLKPNRLTNVWVPFVVAAAASVCLEGRLALDLTPLNESSLNVRL